MGCWLLEGCATGCVSVTSAWCWLSHLVMVVVVVVVLSDGFCCVVFIFFFVQTLFIISCFCAVSQFSVVFLLLWLVLPVILGRRYPCGCFLRGTGYIFSRVVCMIVICWWCSIFSCFYIVAVWCGGAGEAQGKGPS